MNDQTQTDPQNAPESADVADNGPAKETLNGLNLNLPQVLDIGCQIIQHGFFGQPEKDAKILMKELKGGKRVAVGALTVSQKNDDGVDEKVRDIPLSLQLDYTEFVGPGFNFPTLRAALQSLLKQIGTTMRARKDLRIMANETQDTLVVHQPGVVQLGEQYNVLLLAIERTTNESMTLKLMFVDPEQYPPLQKKAAAE